MTKRSRRERPRQGTVAGVPYDVRRLTLDRLRLAYWDPDNDALFTPHAFGAGYSLNFARLLRPVRHLLSRRRPPH